MLEMLDLIFQSNVFSQNLMVSFLEQKLSVLVFFGSDVNLREVEWKFQNWESSLWRVVVVKIGLHCQFEFLVD